MCRNLGLTPVRHFALTKRLEELVRHEGGKLGVIRNEEELRVRSATVSHE